MPNSAEMLIRKLDSIADLTSEDRLGLANVPLRIVGLQPNQNFVRSDDVPRECCLLIEGFMHRYQTLPNGTRQILAFHIPGDIPDLQSLGLDVMDHNLAALVPCKVGIVSHASLHEVMRQFPAVARAFWRDMLIDAAIFRAWITSMGRRSAHGHLAHFLCETFTRLRAVGLTAENTCWLPLTQEQLSDALGLSTVHVNRTLMQLRAQGLIALGKSRLTILDWKGLTKVAHFDPVYLHLRRPVSD